MNGYVKTCKNKDREKVKNKSNKFMSFHLDDDKLLENVKTFGQRLKTCIV